MKGNGSEATMEDYKNTPAGRRTAAKYASIIHMSRPTSNRPKMDLTHRAKIFSPYDALRGFDEAVEEITAMNNRVEKAQLDGGEIEILSRKLTQIRKGTSITVTYFAEDPDGMGIYKDITGTVAEIDPVRKLLAVDVINTDAKKYEKKPRLQIRFEDLTGILRSPSPPDAPEEHTPRR